MHSGPQHTALELQEKLKVSRLSNLALQAYAHTASKYVPKPELNLNESELNLNEESSLALTQLL